MPKLDAATRIDVAMMSYGKGEPGNHVWLHQDNESKAGKERQAPPFLRMAYCGAVAACTPASSCALSAPVN